MGGRGETVPVRTPDSAGISFRIPSGIAAVTSRTLGPGSAADFAADFPVCRKRLVFEIDPVDIACKDGQFGVDSLLQDRHILVEAQLRRQMVRLKTHVDGFGKRPSKFIFEAFRFGLIRYLLNGLRDSFSRS